MSGAIVFAGVTIMWGLICVSNSLDKIAKALSTPDALKGDAK